MRIERQACERTIRGTGSSRGPQPSLSWATTLTAGSQSRDLTLHRVLGLTWGLLPLGPASTGSFPHKEPVWSGHLVRSHQEASWLQDSVAQQGEVWGLAGPAGLTSHVGLRWMDKHFSQVKEYLGLDRFWDRGLRGQPLGPTEGFLLRPLSGEGRIITSLVFLPEGLILRTRRQQPTSTPSQQPFLRFSR